MRCSSLPELLEKKRLIDLHTNVATAVLDHIKVSGLRPDQARSEASSLAVLSSVFFIMERCSQATAAMKIVVHCMAEANVDESKQKAELQLLFSKLPVSFQRCCRYVVVIIGDGVGAALRSDVMLLMFSESQTGCLL